MKQTTTYYYYYTVSNHQGRVRYVGTLRNCVLFIKRQEDNESEFVNRIVMRQGDVVAIIGQIPPAETYYEHYLVYVSHDEFITHYATEKELTSLRLFPAMYLRIK